MAAVDDAPRAKGAGKVDRLTAAQIVVGNAIPVVGVWLLGWEPLTPMFFYWLDGLLAIWGLGVVALVVTSRGEPRIVKAAGWKAVPMWTAVVGVTFFILAVPSIVTVAAMFGRLDLEAGDILHTVFAGLGTWVSLVVAVTSHAGQTIGELRWRPDVTLKATGAARGNLFIHRTLAMAVLVFWGRGGSPSHWALAVYVLLVAALFTAAQLNPMRYLRLIGFREKHART
ncbi:MAG: DUF6498-containing protein [Acidobacteria bacterium]|nr:DUF6498-containing protein [Acidobacteriota bacterium]